jgi:hypothetical protein
MLKAKDYRANATHGMRKGILKVGMKAVKEREGSG